MNYSEEQRIIIAACKNHNNVIVDAVAGSGKTTTLLGIAEALPEHRILGVLFNKSLKEETRLRAQEKQLHLLEVHNYHALARKYYDNTIINDTGITKLLKANTRPIKKLPLFSRLIIDEVQDMNPLYFKLIKKVITDIANPQLKLTVMGDRFQAIYSFFNADTRFLTHADQIHPTITGSWERTSLATTYRCSKTICAFVNESLIGYDRLKPAAQAPGFPVTYIHGSAFQAHKYLFQQIQLFLRQGYKPDDIFILAPSVKSNAAKDTPVKTLENALVDADIPVYVPSETSVEIATDGGNPTLGKIVMTTFHQSKGLERDIVIIYNFDDSYYKFFNRDANPTVLSPELYVAITRCKKHLFVVHDAKNAALQYLRNPSDEYMRIVTHRGNVLDMIPETGATEPTAVGVRNFKASEMTDYLTAEAILEAQAFLRVNIDVEPYTKIPMLSMVQTSQKRYEIVSDLNGIAIPAVYEWRLRKRMRIANEQKLLLKEGKYADRYCDLIQRIVPTQEPSISTVLEIANIFSSFYSGYHHKVAQIKEYNWLSNDSIEPCMKILEENLSTTDIQYEVSLPETIFEKMYVIHGQVDAYSHEKSTLWELKCTENLDHTHEIQLAVYAWIFSKQYPRRFAETTFELLNIRSGESRKLFASAADLEKMMAYLIAEKTRKPIGKTDEEFIYEFSGKFDSSAPVLKQLTIPNMIKAPAAMFIDDAEVKPTPPQIKAPKLIQTNLMSFQETPTPTPAAETPIQSPAATPLEKPLGRVIVFDLETTGLPITPSFGTYYPPTELDKYKQSRIVQWSWALYEQDGTLIKEEDHIIKPNPVEYRIENSKFHGITDQIARVQGKDFATVLALWKTDVFEATTMVGHNVNFDKHVLLSELYRRSYTNEAKELEQRQWLCTMQRAKELCALKAGNKLKPPKLIELMHALNIQEEQGRVFHNAKHDVYYTARCFFAEQILKNPCPKMYEGKHAGKAYDEILKVDRDYVVNAHAVCNIRKLYNSPLRKLSNWAKDLVKSDPIFKEEVKRKEQEIIAMTTE
jgi:DNA polymerase III epsilon subunit-like protein/nucleoside-triphosphatase THEP1